MGIQTAEVPALYDLTFLQQCQGVIEDEQSNGYVETNRIYHHRSSMQAERFNR